MIKYTQTHSLRDAENGPPMNDISSVWPWHMTCQKLLTAVSDQEANVSERILYVKRVNSALHSNWLFPTEDVSDWYCRYPQWEAKFCTYPKTAPTVFHHNLTLNKYSWHKWFKSHFASHFTVCSQWLRLSHCHTSFMLVDRQELFSQRDPDTFPHSADTVFTSSAAKAA